jgi:tetratricopeptide (TPR) repeat protein
LPESALVQRCSVQHYSVGRMPDRKVSKVYSHTLAAALTLSAQAAGAIHLPIVVAYATLVAISGGLALAASARDRTLSGSHQRGLAHAPALGLARVDVGAGVWFALALACLLQALPLPLGWLAQIAPSQADVWERALRPFGSPPPELATLSLAPHRTLVEALKMASYGVIFYVSVRFGRHGMGRIAALAFASALAVALVSLAHRALGAERLFGVYTPSDTAAVAPLLNPNNRAGYENLGFFCGLGWLFRLGSSPRGAFVGVGLLLIVSDILLCQSRGGSACLVLGMLLVPLLRVSPREEPPSGAGRELSRAWQLAIVAVLGAGAAALLAVSRPKGGFGYEASLEKLDLFARVARLVGDHPLFGVGRGAFGSAFSPYQPRAGTIVFEHAENLPLGWAAEWGVPITALALAALAWSLAPVLSRRSLASPVRRCALVGVAVLAAQNLVDLGLEITAIAALFVCVLGGLLGAALGPSARASAVRPDAISAFGTSSTSVETRRGLRVSPDRFLPHGLGLSALCIALVLAFGSDSPARERERLHARLAATNALPDAAFWQALRGALLSYPGDPYFSLLGASAALAAQRDAVPWAARAIERAPESAPAQLVLARALRARGATGQALDAVRRAVELDPESVGSAARTIGEWRLAPQLLARAVPEGPNGAALLQLLADASPSGGRERLSWLEQALEREPGSVAVRHRIALELTRDLLRGEASVLCQKRRDECVRRALEHVRAEPPSPEAAVLEAQLLELSAGPRAAEERLAAACAPFSADERCARELVVLALKNRSERSPAAVRALIAAGCTHRDRCALTHSNLGDLYAALGQWHDAQNHFRQATQEWPTADNWRSLANASAALGQTARAEDARRRAELLVAEKKGAQ